MISFLKTTSLPIIILLFSASAFSAPQYADKQEVMYKNLLVNGFMESGTTKWSASSGALSVVTGGSFLLEGKRTLAWDATAGNQTLSGGTVSIPQQLSPGTMSGLSCNFVCATAGSCTHKIQVTDGTNVLIEQTVIGGKNTLNFTAPSSGYVQPKVVSQADEPEMYLDECVLGDARGINISNVSQATFIGSAYFPTTANCQPTRSSTAMASFTIDTDCGGPIVISNPGPGIIQTTDADLPKITVNNLPPGIYRIVFEGASIITGAANNASFAISDGSITVGRESISGSTSENQSLNLEGIITYTTSGNRSFEIQAGASTSTTALRWSSALEELHFAIYRYPLSSELAINPSTVPFLWSGKHQQDCQWTTASTTMASPAGDSSCSFSQDYNSTLGTVTSTASSGTVFTPGITFTPNSAGVYEVCASFNYSVSGGPGSPILSLTAGTTSTTRYDQIGTSIGSAGFIDSGQLCGVREIASVGSSIDMFIRFNISTNTAVLGGSSAIADQSIRWTIQKLSQSIPAPLLANSITTTSTGNSSMNIALLNCDSGSAITSQLGSWVSSIGNVSGGACTVTLSSGIYSATPYCIFQGNNADPLIMSANATSSTSVMIDCDGNDGTNCTTYDGTLMCLGAK